MAGLARKRDSRTFAPLCKHVCKRSRRALKAARFTGDLIAIPAVPKLNVRSSILLARFARFPAWQTSSLLVRTMPFFTIESLTNPPNQRLPNIRTLTAPMTPGMRQARGNNTARRFTRRAILRFAGLPRRVPRTAATDATGHGRVVSNASRAGHVRAASICWARCPCGMVRRTPPGQRGRWPHSRSVE